MGSYTSRRTYLLNRAAWGVLGFGIICLFWNVEYKWVIVIGCAAIAGLFWFIAGNIEKKRRQRTDQFRDESGNIRPNKL